MTQVQALNLLRLARIEWVSRGVISYDTEIKLRSIGVLVDDMVNRWWKGE